ncbi:MAG: hypothetical protein H0V90_11390 [Blastocatellia bacterium]|nr:hypothetical protein [Blastocatellia bacterium]
MATAIPCYASERSAAARLSESRSSVTYMSNVEISSPAASGSLTELLINTNAVDNTLNRLIINGFKILAASKMLYPFRMVPVNMTVFCFSFIPQTLNRVEL